MDSLVRNCPACDKELTYFSKGNLSRAIKSKSKCKKCSVTINRRGYCKTPTWTGKTLSIEHRRKISKSETGKIESYDTKRKKRIAHIIRLQNRHNQVYPNYNPGACNLIDDYGKQHGYTFQHAENGGELHIKELGYFVDGYDVKKNVVIEVYEPGHKNLKKQKKDLVRKQEISEHLKCEFIELWI